MNFDHLHILNSVCNPSWGRNPNSLLCFGRKYHSNTHTHSINSNLKCFEIALNLKWSRNEIRLLLTTKFMDLLHWAGALFLHKKQIPMFFRLNVSLIKSRCEKWVPMQRYTYRVVQTIQMKIGLGRAGRFGQSLKFKFEI